MLDDPLLGAHDIDTKIRMLLEAEYLRQMARYQRVNQALVHKYKMSFDEFISRGIVEQHGYSWEVEQDAMDWETAIGGMSTLGRKLKELKDPAHG